MTHRVFKNKNLNFLTCTLVDKKYYEPIMHILSLIESLAHTLYVAFISKTLWNWLLWDGKARINVEQCLKYILLLTCINNSCHLTIVTLDSAILNYQEKAAAPISDLEISSHVGGGPTKTSFQRRMYFFYQYSNKAIIFC